MKHKLRLISTSFILLFFPNINFGQAPTLGASSAFAIFTASGSIGNSGTTNMWGDIGSNTTGSSTGSSINMIVGSTHYSDATSSSAATDVATAYTYLNGLSCDSTLSTPFGSGLVLVPGRVYCLTAASTINGDLILDAKGNSSAIFNFKIAGALTTSTSSRVILRNGASFCNVYWQVGGAVILGQNSIFRGTIISDGAIDLLNYDTLEGRGLSKPGAITLSNNKVVGCDASGQPLPIELLSFGVKPSGHNAEINWSTASETNNDYFTIEHSKDGALFEEVLRQKGAGNSFKILKYSAIDNNPYEGTSFYRLKQTDYDGRLTYSHTVALHYNKPFKLHIYPNPFTSSITITLNSEPLNGECHFIIYSILGEEISNMILQNKVTIFKSGHISSGVYFYKLIEDNNVIQSGKLMAF